MKSREKKTPCNKFTFHRGWFKALEPLKDAVKLDVYNATVIYALDNKAPVGLSEEASLAFNIIKADIDKERAKKSAERAKRAEAGRIGMASRWKQQEPKPELKQAPQPQQSSFPFEASPEPVKESPPQKDELDAECERISREEIWLEQIAMKYNLNRLEIYKYIEDFKMECRTSDKLHHDNISDVKRHFNNWLRIYLKNNKDGRNNIPNVKTPQQTARAYEEKIRELMRPHYGQS